MFPTHRILLALLTMATGLSLAFAAPPKVVLIHGESEYGSSRTMPALAESLKNQHGYETVVLTSPVGTTALPSLAALTDADLLILFIRFREATDEQFTQLQDYFDAGKPAIAFRTTSHGFLDKPGWFVPFFGGHYKGHAENAQGTTVIVPAESATRRPCTS